MKLFTDIITSNNIEDYPNGIVLCVRKPYRWTSADVIRKIKFAAIRHFGKKNLKVGHAGTLDPLAEGLLLICIGAATKRAESLQASTKEYIARICFGSTTASYDLEKELEGEFHYQHITRSLLEEVFPSFIGVQEQVAPLFSAKQIDGIRAYEIAREIHAAGGSLDENAAGLLRVSQIEIMELELLEFGEHGLSEPSSAELSLREEAALRAHYEAEGIAELPRFSRINVAEYASRRLPEALIRIRCSKGTYIRSFARDLGERLGSAAFLSGLIRTRCGEYSLDGAIEVV